MEFKKISGISDLEEASRYLEGALVSAESISYRADYRSFEAVLTLNEKASGYKKLLRLASPKKLDVVLDFNEVDAAAGHILPVSKNLFLSGISNKNGVIRLKFRSGEVISLISNVIAGEVRQHLTV